jgi:hypothetical protein
MDVSQDSGEIIEGEGTRNRKGGYRRDFCLVQVIVEEAETQRKSREMV